jgi:hypothetical protein
MDYGDLSVYRKLPLDPTKRHCRVLHLLPGTGNDPICTELNIQDLEDAVKNEYACISYVWGDVTVTRPISIYDEQLQITTNLANCLYHLRDPQDAVVLWIDAICINQDDLDEKLFQVALMKEIYSRGSTVFIWLGAPPDPYSVKLDPFGFIHHFADNMHYHDLPGFYKDGTGAMVFQENEEFMTLWDDFLLVSKSTWWSRAWTVQETILPRNSIVMYGT